MTTTEEKESQHLAKSVVGLRFAVITGAKSAALLWS